VNFFLVVLLLFSIVSYLCICVSVSERSKGERKEVKKDEVMKVSSLCLLSLRLKHGLHPV
jgi:hypothetical protein